MHNKLCWNKLNPMVTMAKGSTSMPPEKLLKVEAEVEEEMGSSDEALLEMLGLTSLDTVGTEENMKQCDEDDDAKLPSVSASELAALVESHQLVTSYETKAACVFPPDLSVSAEHLRRLTEELRWGGDQVQADRSYETINIWKQGEIHQKQTLTRLEHFVDSHEGWSELCHNYLRRLLSAVLGTEMVLYKEKLNLKPPGGSGFAPHLDSPSLRVALGSEGPQTFCTVMLAIDDMTSQNGCLRICKGPWAEENCCQVIQPEENGNPDAGGRAGAIPTEIADAMSFDNVACKGGTVVAFNGWAPHRSSANTSAFPRRAVFLTYNPKSEGDFHTRYYEKMEEMRRGWKESVGLVDRQKLSEDEKLEMDALSTIPTI
jgi:ectoine hydroxylase-related dioxygenase (phytanoyl-CoA dioxygenase family)